MAKRFSAHKAMKLILDETDTFDDDVGEEDSEYEDHISENAV